MPIGTLQIFTSLADEARPLSNVLIRIFKEERNEIIYDEHFMTNLEGLSPIIPLETITRDLSLDENNRERPYVTYNVECMLDGYTTELIQGVQIFEDEISYLPIQLVPDRERINDRNISLIVDHHLLTNYGKNEISNDLSRIQPCTPDYRIVEEEQLKTPERINFVLKGVVIPRQIRVHLGRPTANAENVTVDFIYYIKNVCSSEVYPTWPTEALLANIHAQVSLALNRVYTEWYRSKGYDFDITNNTAFDQAFVKNRNIYENISILVDEVFNEYLRKRNFSEPFYAEYCDGKIAQCPGMKQWGTLTLANQGLNAIQILQRYYTTDVRLVTTERIEDVKGSYRGTPLRKGDRGDDVQLLQQQLNAISVNYPLIQPIFPIDGIYGEDTENAVRVFQRQFNLTADGIVGKSTWYKINYIYIAVRKLAELTSIGRIENEKTGEYPGTILRYGDRNVFVQQLQYYLSVIATYNNAISSINNIDSFFGNQTSNAVRSFQRTYGLTVDGIVGERTWNRIYEVYSSIQGSTNNNQIPAYPGLAIRRGASGDDVLAIQEALNTVSTVNPSIPVLVEDGIFGDSTQTSVIAFQNAFGLDADGIVGPLTWEELFEEQNNIINGNNSSPPYPTYPGTALRINSRGDDVRLIQTRLSFISIYYKTIPSVTVDGIFGVRTEDSVIAFQQLLGLTPDGIVGLQTWNRIQEVYEELAN